MHLLHSAATGDIAAWREAGEFFWLDLVAPDPGEIESVGVLLGWNPLLVEDLQHGEQRPKIEDFADHSLLITYAAVKDVAGDEIDMLEHALVVHGDYLVTVRAEEALPFRRLGERLAANDVGVGEAELVHRVLDIVVDTTMAATDRIAARIDELEQAIDDRSEPDILDELRARRRDLVTLRGVTVAQRDALESLAAALDAIPGFDMGMRPHFRDVTDHARRVVDRLDISRDLLDAAFEAYYTMLVARQGAVTQRLTVLSTIFLPLTFVTGFFGQNFGWMVDHVDSRGDFLTFGVGTTAATAVVLAALFYRLKWW